jgi:hypothetical protein
VCVLYYTQTQVWGGIIDEPDLNDSRHRVPRTDGCVCVLLGVCVSSFRSAPAPSEIQRAMFTNIYAYMIKGKSTLKLDFVIVCVCVCVSSANCRDSFLGVPLKRRTGEKTECVL